MSPRHGALRFRFGTVSAGHRSNDLRAHLLDALIEYLLEHPDQTPI